MTYELGKQGGQIYWVLVPSQVLDFLGKFFAHHIVKEKIKLSSLMSILLSKAAKGDSNSRKTEPKRCMEGTEQNWRREKVCINKWPNMEKKRKDVNIKQNTEYR